MTPDRIRRSLATSRLSVFVEPTASVPVQHTIPAPSPTSTAALILASAQAPPAVVSTPPSDPVAARSILAYTRSRIQAHPVPIRITQILNPTPAPISAPTSSPSIPICPSIPIPSRPPFDISIPTTTYVPTHLAWNELPESEQARLSAQYDDTINRVWPLYSLFRIVGFDSYTRALGLATCDEPDGKVKRITLEKYPELADIMNKFRVDRNLFEFCHHRLFHNVLDAPIDEAMSKLESLFTPSSILHPSSHRLPISLIPTGSLAIDSLAHPYFWDRDRVRRSFVERRPQNDVAPLPRTPELVLGISAYWGLYFAYSPNKTAEEARKSKLSQDLILAIEDLSTVVDTASHSPEATSCRAAMAERCFYALYLSRIVVLSRFLDCLPRDLHVRYARAEWASFQHSPPCTTDGDDIFSVVYRHIMRTQCSTVDLKRTAEARFDSLHWKNLQYFDDEYGTLPFYIVVDEIEAAVPQTTSSGRRPACSRLGINTLFYGFDQPP
ncbi:uncharacterized protein STEHIDRAFT_158186 [Stereum hirsutum FP-91666 SS1]|uniref:uncharacterized protein n=1 Tax=Stereum hirsutum (strain FP-91666) TaxID=721885 RepID=UPI0004449857|nr:uncharacterized protein STEHIDRAFT_158186 [Stereum hirsutum FP-91666 SS1]EIM85555.1 hypothetical protein STEHIDRAFT_158186 [Stereum hirsutum FP-91666 SS1]